VDEISIDVDWRSRGRDQQTEHTEMTLGCGTPARQDGMTHWISGNGDVCSAGGVLDVQLQVFHIQLDNMLDRDAGSKRGLPHFPVILQPIQSGHNSFSIHRRQYQDMDEGADQAKAQARKEKGLKRIERKVPVRERRNSLKGNVQTNNAAMTATIGSVAAAAAAVAASRGLGKDTPEDKENNAYKMDKLFDKSNEPSNAKAPKKRVDKTVDASELLSCISLELQLEATPMAENNTDRTHSYAYKHALVTVRPFAAKADLDFALHLRDRLKKMNLRTQLRSATGSSTGVSVAAGGNKQQQAQSEGASSAKEKLRTSKKAQYVGQGVRQVLMPHALSKLLRFPSSSAAVATASPADANVNHQRHRRVYVERLRVSGMQLLGESYMAQRKWGNHGHAGEHEGGKEGHGYEHDDSDPNPYGGDDFGVGVGGDGSMLDMLVSNLSNAHPCLSFTQFETHHFLGQQELLQRQLVAWYEAKARQQLSSLILSVDSLGDFSGAANDMRNAAHMVASSAVGSSKPIGGGAGSQSGGNSMSVLKAAGHQVTGAVFRPISKLTGGWSNLMRGAAQLGTNSSSPQREVTGFGDGIMQSTEEVGRAVYGGISGLVTKPMRGFQTGGDSLSEKVRGGARGMAEGLGGIVAAPIVATTGAISKISMGLHAQSDELLSLPARRMRPPRTFRRGFQYSSFPVSMQHQPAPAADQPTLSQTLQAPLPAERVHEKLVASSRLVLRPLSASGLLTDVRVRVLAARELCGTVDCRPYCIVSLNGNKSQRTGTYAGTGVPTAPVWYEETVRQRSGRSASGADSGEGDGVRQEERKEEATGYGWATWDAMASTDDGDDNCDTDDTDVDVDDDQMQDVEALHVASMSDMLVVTVFDDYHVGPPVELGRLEIPLTKLAKIISMASKAAADAAADDDEGALGEDRVQGAGVSEQAGSSCGSQGQWHLLELPAGTTTKQLTQNPTFIERQIRSSSTINTSSSGSAGAVGATGGNAGSSGAQSGELPASAICLRVSYTAVL
jgi:hypothetical protein